MIIRENKNEYVLVYSSEGKRIKLPNEEQTYSQATEMPNKPKKWVEVDD